MSILKIKNFQFYHTFIADFEASQGDMVNVCGAEGSGKSTLLNLFYDLFTGQSKAEGVTVVQYPFEEILFNNGIYQSRSDATKTKRYYIDISGKKVILFEYFDDTSIALFNWLNYFVNLPDKPLVIFSTKEGKKFNYIDTKVLELC